jgi:hypothetical protein
MFPTWPDHELLKSATADFRWRLATLSHKGIGKNGCHRHFARKFNALVAAEAPRVQLGCI